MQSKSTFPARIAPFSVLEPLLFSRVGLRKARFMDQRSAEINSDRTPLRAYRF